MKLALRMLTVLVALALGVGHWSLIGYPKQYVTVAQSRVISASVEPLPLEIHCPGAFVQLGGADGTDLGTVERLGEARIFWQGSALATDELPEESTNNFATAKSAQNEQSTQLLSMLQVQAIDQSRALGLQASYCPQPLSAGWLPNGSAVSGAESVLIAANPAAVEVLIELEVHMANQVVEDSFALAPGEEQLISLARYANGEELFAVYFQTNGPEILMALQNRETRGLTPIGLELALPVAEPAKSMAFVGLRELTGGFTLPELRVYNTSDQPADVALTALDGENVELFRLQVPAGGFEAIDLKVSENYQLVALESDQPVIAAIKSHSLEPLLDFAWILPAERFSSLALPLPRYRSSLVLANPDSAAVEINVSVFSGSDSSVQSFVLPALGTLAVPVAGESVLVTGASEFLAALEIIDAPGYSLIRPTENANLGDDLKIQIN